MKPKSTLLKPKHAKLCLAVSIHMALFGALSPTNALAYTPQSGQPIKKNSSLERLSSYYHTKSNDEARCQGVWVHPRQERTSLTQELGHEQPADRQVTNESQAQIMHSSEQNAYGQIKPDATDGTYYAQADYGYYGNDEYAELSGNVILEQNGQQVFADKITFNPKTGESTATGQVIFGDTPTHTPVNQSSSQQKLNETNQSSAGIIGVANKLQYNAKDKTAKAQDVAFASTTIGAHGHAKELKKINDANYQMDEVMFTTCPPTERKWHLNADSIEIDTNTGRGIAKNSTLKIKDIPVFYLPYFNFPIDARRSSGFLLPNVGINSSDGVQVDTPYYFNLAPNFDATLTPTLFSNKNPMLGAEFRYLTKKYGSGTFDVAYLPNDRKRNNKDRYHVFFDHEWHAKNINNLSAYATYRHVSDTDYLNDFDTLGLKNNPLNLPRRIGVNYYNEHLNADFRAETFQTLGGTNHNGTPIADKDKPYSKLPQLMVDYTLPKSDDALGQKLRIPSSLDKLDITGTHNIAYFKKSINDNSESEKSGLRMYNQLSASYPMLRSWGYLTPKLSLNHLYASYDEDSLTAQNLIGKKGTYSVFAPQFSLDTATFFEKSGSPFGWFDGSLDGYQVLSPRIKYNHTPYKDQRNIPNFKAAYAAISYDQLLSDSWLLGHDRIQDLHAITPALSYRYIDKDGNTRLHTGVAQQFYLDNLKVGLKDNIAKHNGNSGLAWQVSAQPINNLWVESDGSFTPNYDLNHINAQLRYQPKEHSLYSLGVINRKETPAFNQLPLHAYTAAAIFPINNHWRVLSQAQYDYRNDRLLDALVGINYEDCCYGLSVYVRRYRNSLNPEARANNAIMAEIRLNGITSGGRLNRLMSDKVIGYDSTQSVWQQSY
ncbi:LPS assembly protein LptD [Moraxella haemolytica]|uniref:LPS assembly protein LptD n=1 Tax=Moraxella haemolytica TaxID=2904119 RepID=UPI002542E3F9|nr:LPS assembly protein LptD [Moraxella sp. ZY171148]WII95840.1 LPS assembly protein LptD [Moraxella sp. ZY171148]